MHSHETHFEKQKEIAGGITFLAAITYDSIGDVTYGVIGMLFCNLWLQQCDC